jgi:catechol 2,3-dioxygenase-like lactoylglutathione lyase family enzyme
MQTKQVGVLNHLSFPTTDPAATAAFFEKYLDCRVMAAGEHYLVHSGQFDIVLESVPEQPVWPKSFHFGYEVDTLAQVNAMYKDFADGGVHMETSVFNNSRGSRFFCRTPGGVMVEVNTREDKQDDWKKLF